MEPQRQWPTPDAPYAPYHAQLAEKPKKRRRWPWVVGIVAAFVIGIGVGGVQPATPPLEGVPQASTQAAPADASQPSSSPQDQPSQAVTEAQKAVEQQTAGIGSGTFIVGVDIEKGTYRSTGAEAGLFEFCSWTTKSGASSNSKIIDIGTANANEPMVVEIDDKVKAFESNGCEPWEKVD